MREGPRVRGFPIFGTAAAGLVLGHALAYLIAIPDPHQRVFALQRTGHAYLPALDQAVLMLVVAGMAAVVVRAFAHTGDRTERFGRLATILVAAQTCAFAAQEVLERLIAHAPLGGLAHDHILVTGIAVQVVVAIVAAAILWLFARTATRLAAVVATRTRLPRIRVAFALPVTARTPHAPVFATADSVRAPPSS